MVEVHQEATTLAETQRRHAVFRSPAQIHQIPCEIIKYEKLDFKARSRYLHDQFK